MNLANELVDQVLGDPTLKAQMQGDPNVLKSVVAQVTRGKPRPCRRSVDRTCRRPHHNAAQSLL